MVGVLMSVAAGGSLKAQCEYGTKPSLPQRAVADRPAVVLASQETGPLAFGRLLAARRDARGQLAVFDATSQELRYFSSTGAHLRTASRRGGGPGELSNAVSLEVAGDTTLVIEHPPARSQVHRFTSARGFLRRDEVRAKNVTGTLTALARLTSGELVVVPGGFVPFEVPNPGMLRRDSLRVGILGSDSGVTWLGTYPGALWVGYPLSPGVVSATAMPHPLGSFRIITASGDKLWVGNAGSGSVSVYRHTGVLLKRFRLRGDKRFPSPALLRRHYIAEAVGAPESIRQGYAYLGDTMILPEAPPTFTTAVPDDAGGVWLRCFSLSGGEGSRWVQILEDRGPVAWMTLPGGFTLQQVSGNDLVGITETDDGLQSIAVLRFATAGPAR